METQRALLLSTIGLLIALSLVVGCAPQRKVLPDSEETPAGDSQASSGDESAPDMSDLQKTAQANSATATAAAASEAVDAEGTTPTELPPTEPVPTTLPTPVEPTSTVAPTEPAPTATTEPSTGTGGETTYVVQRGDTLFSIARRYGTTVEAIAARNGIANPSLISTGQTLVIPASGTSPSTGGQTYVVQRGDNLFRIALRYNMSYVDLAQYNGISDPSRIYVGQVIRIPPR